MKVRVNYPYRLDFGAVVPDEAGAGGESEWERGVWVAQKNTAHPDKLQKSRRGWNDSRLPT